MLRTLSRSLPRAGLRHAAAAASEQTASSTAGIASKAAAKAKGNPSKLNSFLITTAKFAAVGCVIGSTVALSTVDTNRFGPAAPLLVKYQAGVANVRDFLLTKFHAFATEQNIRGTVDSMSFWSVKEQSYCSPYRNFTVDIPSKFCDSIQVSDVVDSDSSRVVITDINTGDRIEVDCEYIPPILRADLSSALEKSPGALLKLPMIGRYLDNLKSNNPFFKSAGLSAFEYPAPTGGMKTTSEVLRSLEAAGKEYVPEVCRVAENSVLAKNPEAPIKAITCLLTLPETGTPVDDVLIPSHRATAFFVRGNWSYIVQYYRSSPNGQLPKCTENLVKSTFGILNHVVSGMAFCDTQDLLDVRVNDKFAAIEAANKASEAAAMEESQ